MTHQTAAGASTRLEDLQAGLRLSGLLPQTVSIVAVSAHGPDAVTVIFQDVSHHLATERIPVAAAVVRRPGRRR